MSKTPLNSFDKLPSSSDRRQKCTFYKVLVFTWNSIFLSQNCLLSKWFSLCATGLTKMYKPAKIFFQRQNKLWRQFIGRKRPKAALQCPDFAQKSMPLRLSVLSSSTSSSSLNIRSCFARFDIQEIPNVWYSGFGVQPARVLLAPDIDSWLAMFDILDLQCLIFRKFLMFDIQDIPNIWYSG